MLYILAPFIGWLTAGAMKFIVNYIRFGSDAKNRIGNGGFPSNHTTIISTTIMFIGFKDSFFSPIFSLGISVAFIIIIDAIGLRRHVGYHAEHLNKINNNIDGNDKLRESMGHTKFEVLGGVLLGSILASLLFWINSYL